MGASPAAKRDRASPPMPTGGSDARTPAPCCRPARTPGQACSHPTAVHVVQVRLPAAHVDRASVHLGRVVMLWVGARGLVRLGHWVPSACQCADASSTGARWTLSSRREARWRRLRLRTRLPLRGLPRGGKRPAPRPASPPGGQRRSTHERVGDGQPWASLGPSRRVAGLPRETVRVGRSRGAADLALSTSTRKAPRSGGERGATCCWLPHRGVGTGRALRMHALRAGHT